MRFRPCIDIHNGKVKQIVGGSLTDVQDQAKENFVSEQDAAFYAELYKKAGIVGGHVILLNSQDSPNYEATKQQALLALRTYPGGLQIGGGVNPGNVQEYLEAGASHVIVTSYVFKDGKISWEKLEEMEQAAGKEHLVLDLSCRKKVEGKAHGVETELAELLSGYTGRPVTYAGGVGSMKDIEDLRTYGGNRLDVTVGSALDLFGGSIPFTELVRLK